MPLKNRVLPDGRIVAHSGRGLLMGNRGCLHDAGGAIVRPWRGRRWIACLTQFRARRRALLQPGRYTELFFLDEAVALAAGHRPCAECRRDDYERFRAAWDRAGLPGGRSADAIDHVLHAARLGQGGASLPLADLPAGAFLSHGGEAWLVTGGGLRRHDPGGYRETHPAPPRRAPIMTPLPLLAAISAGYAPLLHPTAASAAAVSQSDKPGP